jgi:uncharacterized protein (TIGR02118 family)
MVKLICFLKRRPGMTHEEFDAYWRERHGPLVASTKSARHVLRYEQHPPAEPGGPWDGVTEQWFESVDAFYASLKEDDYHLIDADLPNFLDVSALQFLLTDEPRVVIS